MDWDNLTTERFNSFGWTDDVEVDINDIKNSLIQVYNKAPSKNQKYPFTIKLVKNNNNLKLKLMTVCHRNTDLSVQEDAGNPQVLAPYILGFCRRDIEETATKQDYRIAEDIENYSCLEMGIQATYIMLELKNRGLDTGIVSCIQDQDIAAELLGLPNKCKLILGIGYSNYDTRSTREDITYWDPRIETVKPIPFPRLDKDIVYPKPEFKEVYQWEN